MSIRTKVFLPKSNHSNGEIRRWKVESFQELQERIQKILEADSIDRFQFQYLDDVNDWIVLEQPDEWEEAVTCSANNVLVVRIIPIVRKQPDIQRPPTRRGSRFCVRNHACAHIPTAIAGALPFIIQLTAPAPTVATRKISIPIQGADVSEDIQVRITKSVPVPIEAKEEVADIPVTIAPPRVIRSIPIEDGDATIEVKRCNRIEVEEHKQENTEVPVTVAPARDIRSIPIEQAEEDEPTIEKEESKPLEVSGIIENEYTIEDDEDDFVDASTDDEKKTAPQQKKQWQNEEEILQSMGFSDSKLNYHLLSHHNGNMERTINSLLQLEQ